ncbi:signal peptide peptidase SppA, partial [bacterium]|nr:signal peptide peptidase SppA [bacterium]
AVILLVDSPGGEVTATDIIYHEIKSFKERRNIPVIADISSVGASGAYYIAMASDRIVARPTSIVGSIGVIISSVNLTPLMEKIGVESVTYKSGAHKDMGSPLKPPSKDDDELFNSIIRQLHSQFVTIVTQNRKLDPARIDQITDGRVFSAQQALENHLIDKIGYFKDTVALAKRVANIKSESVIIYHREGEFIENVYHVSDTSVMFQMMGLNLERLFTNDTPKFLYLWRP